MLFLAGAACAGVVAAQWPKSYLSGAEWDVRMNAWLKEGELLGAYVVEVHRGRALVNPDGPIACPKPPQPKLPDAAVKPWTFDKAVEAGVERNKLLMLGANASARETARCETAPPELVR